MKAEERNLNEPQKPQLNIPVVTSSAIAAYPYNGSNGIIICCRSCGREIEETDGGFYPPIQYENEKFERQCSQCRNM